MGTVSATLKYIKDILDVRLFNLGSTEFTLWIALYLIVLVVALVVISRIIKRWLINSVLARGDLDLGVRQAIATISQYLFLLFGLLIILSTAGIDLTALNVLAGAIGIGVGFGFQTIANNFISGLIILFERPVKVGDRIQVGDVAGDVVRIGARATTVKTNDNIEIIIPNAEFISSQVTNWSHSDREVRLHIPVGVSYSSDPEKVRDILLEVAASHKGVLKRPAPDVIFTGFGDSALQFDLRVWTSEYIAKPQILQSDLNFVIRRQFKAHGIEIPFPQRDIHVRSGAFALQANDGKKGTRVQSKRKKPQ
jgi:small-conductance mechanosensitive channel